MTIDSTATTVESFSECDSEGRTLAVVYRCRERWEDLQATENDQVRYCNSCSMPVFRVADTADFHRAIAAGRCVMVQVAQQRQYFLGMPATVPFASTSLVWDD